ncbi:MAG: hypothetical protein E6K74_00165 [Candidatus Eisenbacteria bacterium]|uniref:TolB N-terminal domain-containing protein n=1 Tax=Eiseniibacteriota bacterium TaxID=2212470 RepID=A0A538SYB9_UNCEI|nr:MAG: hypothetical protein E6K74_00165 [Candidatus Eisenbacteria bacterium]
MAALRPRAVFVLGVAALLLTGTFLSTRVLRAQTQVRIGVKATGTMKSPLLLARFRGYGPVGSLPNQGRAIARNDFELSGVFVVADVEPVEGKPTADPSLAGTVRVEGIVEVGGGGGFFQFRGQAIDVGTGEMALERSYPFTPGTLRQTMHQFVDDVLEALTGERGIAETKMAYVKQDGRVKEIWMMDYDGENGRQVTHDHSLALSPIWAPWGSELAFTTFKRGNPDLYLFDLNKAASYPFSTRPGLNTAPNYSPDGKWIACTLSRDGNAEIYLISRHLQPNGVATDIRHGRGGHEPEAGHDGGELQRLTPMVSQGGQDLLRRASRRHLRRDRHGRERRESDPDHIERGTQ